MAVLVAVKVVEAFPAVPRLVANFPYYEQEHLDLALDPDLVAGAVVVVAVDLVFVQP